jgi:hypothetical protein
VYDFRTANQHKYDAQQNQSPNKEKTIGDLEKEEKNLSRPSLVDLKRFSTAGVKSVSR